MTDLISPSPESEESDGDGAWDGGLDTENKRPVSFWATLYLFGTNLNKVFTAKTG